MEDLTKYTPTQLLHMLNDNNAKHESLKKDIINHTIEVDELTVLINDKLKTLEELEKNYITLVEEINNR